MAGVGGSKGGEVRGSFMSCTHVVVGRWEVRVRGGGGRGGCRVLRERGRGGGSDVLGGEGWGCGV